MFYNLSLHINAFLISSALAAATIYVLISLLKEKRDERKRA